jgi:hypothetical protein
MASKMKKLSVLILLVFMAGCAPKPEKLKAVAVQETAQLTKPSKPFSAFSTYELRPFILSSGVRDNGKKSKHAVRLEGKIKEKLLPLFENWSSKKGAGRSGTLIVQPRLVKLRVVSGGARFWLGPFGGKSNIDLEFKIIDSSTKEVIAQPVIGRRSGAWAGGWSIGKTDRNLYQYIAHITHEYFASNYE